MDEEFDLDRKFPFMKPVNSAPSMHTINGIGLTLYGNREFDNETQTYLKSYCFCILFVPIFWFSSYRVADASDGGRAYLFDATTGGAQIQTFFNPTPATDDQFGRSVAVSGNNVVIGANFDDTRANEAGAAYLFDITTCDNDTTNGGTAGDGICEAATLTFLPPTTATDQSFGSGVSISGNNVLVAAPGDDTLSTNAGAAHLFDITTCDNDTTNGGIAGDFICEAVTQTFFSPTPAAADNFGNSVSISGNNVLVGEFIDNPGGIVQAGAAYLFDATSGNLVHSFFSPNPAAGDRFGNWVSVSGDDVLIGSPGGLDGEAYLFDATTGNLVNSYSSPNPGVSDAFGNSVSIDGTNVMVGALADTGAIGAAYLFDTAQKVQFTPALDFIGIDTFDYTISDGNGGVDTATVSVDVLSQPTIKITKDTTDGDGAFVFTIFNGTSIFVI